MFFLCIRLLQVRPLKSALGSELSLSSVPHFPSLPNVLELCTDPTPTPAHTSESTLALSLCPLQMSWVDERWCLGSEFLLK